MYEPNDDVRPAGAEVDEFDDAPPERAPDTEDGEASEDERARERSDEDVR